jgi:acyl carrier protein
MSTDTDTLSMLAQSGRVPTTDIETEIRGFLAKFLPATSDQLGGQDRLLGSIVDSNGVIEFVVFLEMQFGITVVDEDVTAENLDSIENTVAFVTRKLSEQGSGQRHLDISPDGVHH